MLVMGHHSGYRYFLEWRFECTSIFCVLRQTDFPYSYAF